MPELPEVETIARQLSEYYVGKTIAEVDAKPARIYQNISASEFASALKGKKLEKINRYGKFMYWDAGKVYPVFHLGMSGIFVADKSVSNYPGHIHISFEFDNGRMLHFQDVRKFSKVFLYHKLPEFRQLGLDPTTQNFTLTAFRKLLNLRAISIKSFLMDQTIIAGIGNIYANEILFEAKINPFRPANKINKNDSQKLYAAISKILGLAIDHFGTSYTAYRTVEGDSGENQNFLKVYQQNGLPCMVCGTLIDKSVINSRSTFYCRKCQEK